MIVTSAALTTLRTGFSTLFKGALAKAESQYGLVSTTVPATTREQRYGWLGKFPNVREWIGARVIQNLMESDYTIREKKWEMTIGVDRDDVETDNLGIYSPMFEEMGQSTGSFWDRIVFQLLSAGFTTNCYDGQFFFDIDHPVLADDGTMTLAANTDAVAGNGPAWFLIDDTRALKPIILQKRKDFEFVARDNPNDSNVFGLNEFVYGADARANVGYGFWQFAWGSKQDLTAANYKLARASLLGMKGDYGRPLGIRPTLLLVPPQLESAALKLINNELGANGETNEWKGTAKVVVCPWLA
ncbi:Mu-like prophage major head subunit gpT family protein [Sphingomonas sp.]|uniref:Mu-like prophage major head subunit gpT family protein n=1 Tax=Sphingomonas sp. TaxID=28214 RepID=UPI003CC5908E